MSQITKLNALWGNFIHNQYQIRYDGISISFALKELQNDLNVVRTRVFEAKPTDQHGCVYEIARKQEGRNPSCHHLVCLVIEFYLPSSRKRWQKRHKDENDMEAFFFLIVSTSPENRIAIIFIVLYLKCKVVSCAYDMLCTAVFTSLCLKSLIPILVCLSVRFINFEHF